MADVSSQIFQSLPVPRKQPESSWQCQGEWLAKGLESPTVFSSIDLQEGEWFDYDEKAGEEVSIKDLKWEFRRA